MSKNIISSDQILNEGKEILEKEANALLTLKEQLNDDFIRAVNLLLNIKGRIAVTGMGKSGHIARKISATLASTGSSAYFIHPAEASHGDLGMMSADDALIAISNSGNTAELSDILIFADTHSLPVIAITSNPNSPLGLHSTVCLTLPKENEACPLNCAPTTSTTMSLGLGDAIAMSLMQARGFTREDFKNFHPGGSLGQKLLKVKDVMHTGDEIPLANISSPMSNVIIEMSSKGLGCVGILDNDKLVGIITDGDLRRAINNDIMSKNASDIMTHNPYRIESNKSIKDALFFLNEKKITSLFVIDKNDNILGIIHIHDLKN